jgi:transposase
MKPVTTPEIERVIEPVLCMALELGASQWKIAFSTGLGQRPRFRVIPARDLVQLAEEISTTKRRFDLADDSRIASCFEAGRDGFWLDRALGEMGIENLVVDSASIEVNRRKRRAKTDRLDAAKLVGMLLRFLSGDANVWKVVRVPSVEDEDRRQLHRELATTKRDRTRIVNRIRALLFAQGVCLAKIQDLPKSLNTLQLWNGEPLPAMLRDRLKREWQKIGGLNEQIQQLRAQRRRMLRTETDRTTQYAGRLLKLAGLGENGSWLLSSEFFAWRDFKNARQVGALAGLTGTPFQSGDAAKDQGICKAGNRWVRHMAIELAWGWLRYQPQSDLSQWYQRRFAHGGSRLRRIGIVAMARKLLVALWRYVETGVPTAGAVVKA